MVTTPYGGRMDPRAVLKRLPVPVPGLGGDPVLLELDLAHGIVTAPPAGPLQAWQQRQAPTLAAVRRGLRRAARDRDVVGLLVHVGNDSLGLAPADEVADLVARFSEHKPSIAWAETFGELSSGMAGYRVASAADEVWLQPSGMLGLTGVHVAITLLRGGLDKLGLDPELGQRHEYKSAADQLAAPEVTPANREMMQRIATSLLDDTVARVAQRRGLDPAAVDAAVAAAPLSATAALEAGLVDRVGYRDEVYTHARDTWSRGTDAALRYVHRYAQESAAQRLGASVDRRPGVAVVDVRGPIVTGHGRSGQAGADVVAARLRAAGRDDKVEGLLLRVDSPGGSYVASDTIHREVALLRESGRPVVATMGAVAASGGYFVAMGADEVLAQPTTLTGSIGVLAGKLVAQRLLDRIGVVRESVTAGPRAAMMAVGQPFTDEEWRVLDGWLDDVYADFTGKAAADRGLDLADLEPLARGRVWTGVDALEHGLVDHLGGTDLALDRLCDLADLDRDRVVLRSGPALPFLARLRPAESSESGHAAAVVSAPTSDRRPHWPGSPAGPASRSPTACCRCRGGSRSARSSLGPVVAEPRSHRRR